MKMKNQSGITLVALVVTIVVLLILAGVSINLVLGENGLITQAKEAREQTKSAEVNEKSQMDSVSDFISETVNNTELPQTNETKPYMPGDGFTKVEGTNLANGLTIKDTDGNQYVWVEVPMTTTVYPTAGLNITEFTTDEYTKIENDLHTYTSTYRNGTNYKDEWNEDTNNTADWYTQEQYTAQKQKMLKSVYQNGGFWVARYEAGLTEENKRKSKTPAPTIKPQSKENLIPYNYVTRPQAKKIADMVTYIKGKTTYTGSLMFGVQWDLVLKFIETKKATTDTEIVSKLNSDSTTIGNYYNSTFTINRGKYAKYNVLSTWYNYKEDLDEIVSSTIKTIQSSNSNGILLTTGAAETHKLMNIYDIAGNVWEWTLEWSSNNNYPAANRGGGYSHSGSKYSAFYRDNNGNSDSYDSLGFRISLY